MSMKYLVTIYSFKVCLRTIHLPLLLTSGFKAQSEPNLNRLLFAEDIFMAKMHLRQPGFTYSTFGPFAGNKVRMQKFDEKVNPRCICQNKLIKLVLNLIWLMKFLKYLPRRAVTDKVPCDKRFNIAKTHAYDGYKRGISSMVYTF